MAKGREHFGSNTAAVMAMAGSAIGLGNIWRFPYMVGEYGGAAFIILYLLAALFLSLPIFLSESIIGRASSSCMTGAMKKLAPGTKWRYMGLLAVIAPTVILSYYSVVGGWSMEYLGKSVADGFSEDISSIFGQFISAPVAPLICHTIFLSVTAFIVSKGVKSGIERFNKYSMPVLFILIVVIMLYSLTLPGAMAGVEYLVKPDISKVSLKTFAFAMGQSFFSLSLGVGTILTYSSYMKKEDRIFASGVGTTILDLMFALLAGFAIMPAVFSAGIEPGSGPGLIFETLPFIFAKMSAAAPIVSRVVSILFFLTIVIAALTSSISLIEVVVAYLVEEKKMSRKKAVVLVFAITWSIGVLCSLSFGPLSGVKLFGETIFSFCDKLASNFLMTIGSLLFVIFVGWKMSKEDVRREFTNNGTLKSSSKIFGAVYFFIRYIAPIVIALIFLTNLAQ